MKFSTLFSLLLFVAVQFTVTANAISEKQFIREYYPSLEEVLTYVTQTIRYECKDGTYGIAKNDKGYFLTVNAAEKKSTGPDFIMVWDRGSGEFVSFEDEIKQFYSERRLREVPEEFKWIFNQSVYFDFFLYYGYANWAEDTRLLLSKETTKTAEDLEILARLHASLAEAFLRPELHQDYLELDRTMGLKDEGFGKTSPLQKARFEEHSKLSIDYWKQLKKDYPAYAPLIIDNTQLKLGHEYMHFYLLSKSIKENGLTRTFLNDAYYPEAWVQFAKNILDACDENGLLITAGDNDTYTVLYVQERLGIRTDVKVINIALLNTPWYWEMIRNDLELTSNIKQEDFAALNEKPVFVDYQAISVPFTQWLEKELKSTSEENYRLIPAEILLPYNDGTLRLEMKTTDLQTSDLLLLDILASNKKLQAFTSAPYTLVNLGFYYNLATTGRAFSIVHDREKAMERVEAVQHVEDLAFYTTLSYLEAMGSQGAGEMSILSYLVLNISPVFEERRKDVIEKIYKYLTPKDVVVSENLELLDALNSFYEVLKPEASEELRIELQPIAEEIILNTTAISNTLEEDLEKLEFLFSIYGHFRVHETPEYEIEFSELDRHILTQIKEKIEQLTESPVVAQRGWIRLKIGRLLTAFDRISLD